MLKLDRVTKVKMLFLVLVFVFNFDVPKFSAAILEKGLFVALCLNRKLSEHEALPTQHQRNLKTGFSLKEWTLMEYGHK